MSKLLLNVVLCCLAWWSTAEVAISQDGKLVDRLRQKRATLSRPLRVVEFEDAAGSLSHYSEEWKVAWKWFKDDQADGFVKFDDLYTALLLKRDLARSIEIKYRFRRESTEMPPLTGEGEFLRSGDNTLFNERRSDTDVLPGTTGLGESRTIAASSTAWRESFADVNDHSSRETLTHTNLITPPKPLERLYADENPLRLAGQIDSRLKFEQSQADFDLTQICQHLRKDQSAIIQAHPEIVDGRKCALVIVAPDLSKLYFAVNESMSLTLVEHKTCGESLDEARRWKCVASEQTRFLNFEEDGGLWLPRRILRTSTSGSEAVTLDIEILSVSVNSKIDPRRFIDIFSKDAIILDEIRGLNYMPGEAPPIKQTEVKTHE